MGRMNRRRDRWLKRFLELVLRPFLAREKADLETILAARPGNILLVRQHNQMGDMLCATPSVRAIRQTFPEARITLLTAPVNDGVVRNNPDLDGILLFDKREVRKSPRAAWAFLRRLRGLDTDCAFVLNTISFSSTSAWLAVLSGARHIVGGSSTAFGWSFSEWLYSLETPLEPVQRVHAIDHGLGQLEAIGIVAHDRNMVLVPGEDAEVLAREFVDSLGPGPLAVVHPGAGKIANRWAPDRFASAIRELESLGARVFLSEGPMDQAEVAATLDALGSDRPVLRGLGLRADAAVIGMCAVALVNDTGVMHIAGAMRTPGVALFGPTRAALWAPPGGEIVAIQSPDSTMDGITVESVLPVLRERFGRGRQIRPRP